jgi:putative membrane protein
MSARQPYPKAAIQVAEKPATRWIWIFSAIVFTAVVVLNRVQVQAPEGLDVHVFAKVNAVLNSLVSLLLLAGLFTAKAGNWKAHRAAMLSALVLSVLFLVSYILHHLFAGDTKFGGTGAVKVIYYLILFTHIVLAGLSLPFILLTAFRALKAEFPAHRKLARRVWPVWFYVSVTGVVVYLMISPYYGT